MKLNRNKFSVISSIKRRITVNKISKLTLFLLTYISLFCVLSVLYAISIPSKSQLKTQKALAAHTQTDTYPTTATKQSEKRIATTTPINTPTQPTPTPIPPTKTPEPTKTQPTPQPPKESSAEQIDENTWKVRVEPDSQMATPQEIFEALNTYRSKRGVGQLSWDSGLADYAQERANLFSSNGGLDSHAGFRDFMNNGGFEKTGFNGLGENSAYMAGPLSGTSIIESLFAADAPHDNNQTDPSWTHVGIGLSGNAVNVNFGKR